LIGAGSVDLALTELQKDGAPACGVENAGPPVLGGRTSLTGIWARRSVRIPAVLVKI
jgi:hypothetical protein